MDVFFSLLTAWTFALLWLAVRFLCSEWFMKVVFALIGCVNFLFALIGCVINRKVLALTGCVNVCPALIDCIKVFWLWLAVWSFSLLWLAVWSFFCSDWLCKAFLCSDWLYEAFLCSDWLYEAFHCSDWLYEAFVCSDWLTKVFLHLNTVWRTALHSDPWLSFQKRLPQHSSNIVVMRVFSIRNYLHQYINNSCFSADSRVNYFLFICFCSREHVWDAHSRIGTLGQRAGTDGIQGPDIIP